MLVGDPVKIAGEVKLYLQGTNKATLREAAYWAKLSSLPGPSRAAREKPALTPALRRVTRAQLQSRFVIESPFVALFKKEYRIDLAASIARLRFHWIVQPTIRRE
jgi:hypothetical protein